MIHDFEIALVGATSEDVDESLGPGRFGMADETGRLLNDAIVAGTPIGRRDRPGGVARSLAAQRRRSPHLSVLAAAARLNIPVTVHVAIGTDIIHMHPAASGAAFGEGSLRDFRYFVANVAQLEGGVYLNCGSAVVLPEVFLKAVALARNRGLALDRPDDGQPRFRPAVPAADQCRHPADRRHRPRLLARRTPRNHDSAARAPRSISQIGEASRTIGEAPLKSQILILV